MGSMHAQTLNNNMFMVAQRLSGAGTSDSRTVRRVKLGCDEFCRAQPTLQSVAEMSRLLRVALSWYLQLGLLLSLHQWMMDVVILGKDVTGSRSLLSRAISKRSQMWGGDGGIQHYSPGRSFKCHLWS